MKSLTNLNCLFLMLAGLGLFAAESSAQPSKQIEAIRAKVNLINKSAKRFRHLNRSVEGISLEGAEATYLFSGRELIKVNAKMYGETFRATAELYYAAGELIFAFQRLEGYDTHIAANPPPKVSKVVETRVYFSGGKAIRVIEGQKRLKSTDADFRGAEEGITDLSEKLKAAIHQ